MFHPQDSSGGESPGIVVQHAPRFGLSAAVEIARTLFGIEADARELPSERDQNFRLTAGGGAEFVLKIANATEQIEILDLQNKAIEHLAARGGSAVPTIGTTLTGDEIARVAGPDGRTHFVRLLTYVPGVPFAQVKPHSADLLRSLGRRVGEMDRALRDFSHPAMHRPLPWELGGGGWIRDHIWRFTDSASRALVERALDRFESIVAPLAPSLRASVIHNDWNNYNVLVSPDLSADREVVGAIDFGDMVHSYTVVDLAIAAAYAMLGKPDPISAAAQIVRGYHEVLPLTEPELSALYDLICLRLAVSVTMAAWQREMAPGNEYLRISERHVWALFEHLGGVAPQWAHYAFRDACGLPPCPGTRTVIDWLTRNRAAIGRLVDYDLQTTPAVALDLSAGSLEIGDVRVLDDAKSFSGWVSERLEAARAVVGLGRYNEARLAYSSEQFKAAEHDGQETRTVHLGVDLFLPPGTPVYAPLDGEVHSFRINAAPRHHGPTIVLAHRIDGASEPFYTLYGHLTAESLDDLREGTPVERGDRIGRIGDIDVTGGWPPHLHFQVIIDLLGRRGDFPGVAAPSQRRIWLSVSPDPNGILQAPERLLAHAPPSRDDLLRTRRHHVSRSLSVSYRKPLTIVRGYMQYLFDEDGRRYLDAVNNVAHVGHCHPRVVKAASDQMAVLNTNTRYLHESLGRYAERLCALLPEPLSVCFLVNSGSEANELALRLARTHTRQTNIVVIDGAYHGNTSSLIDISPYKCEGPGGGGLPPHVHKVPMPDLYRGPYRSSDPEAGARYAADVEKAVDRLGGAGRRVAAFFCESLLSCGGQIVLPDNYLEAAYRAVRRAGGVCVADEVQTGFGRVGSHMWGFETQHVVPDIVTLGKPIGNGHPLGAVVTTPEIAASFDNGMEYFNTFGGSPVACAVGLAVLDVLRDEGLQHHALKVGAYLKRGLESLMTKYPLIGDVRGLGFFLGIELITSRETLAPAADQAGYIINRMRERGVLVSTDGPLHNVIKIKPPLVFTEADADFLLDTLESILGEDPVQPHSGRSLPS